VRSAEVAVVGAGIVGAACAWELHMRGVDVALIDRGDVSSGTTGLGEGNVLCSDKPPGPELDLTIAGLDVYDEIDERWGEVARIRRKGALIVHPEPATWATEPQRVGLMPPSLKASLLGADEVREREPALTGELHGASLFPGDLQCDPRAIARALAGELPDVRTGCVVNGIAVAAGRVTGVETSEGHVAAGAVVLAAGPWSAALSPVPLPVEPRKGQLVRLRAPASGSEPYLRHKVVDGSYLAAVLSPDAGLQVSTVIETTWDGDVLVGSSRERKGFDTTVDASVSAGLVSTAARIAPGLAALQVATAWAGLRPWLPDNLPAIGPSAAVDGLWIATGHEGAGVALGPITGRLVAQLYCGEAASVDVAPFCPDRFL
jgi:glycine/D-amino acid oxidase-like deaminating enzyme